MFEPLDVKSRLGLVAFGNLLDFVAITCCFGLEATGVTGTLTGTGWFFFFGGGCSDINHTPPL